ncbi:MAG: glycosyltransferase [Methanotrichaceae archaeon]|nr:glycosyltransferase [Methanotrichaceae archaeon]
MYLIVMRALHVTMRYGRDLYGGAEYYMRKLNEELLKRGLEIDLCTTKTNKLRSLIKSGVLWDNTLNNETVDGIRVFRCTTNNPNKYVSIIFEKIIQYQLDREEASADQMIRNLLGSLYDINNGILLSGWHSVERYSSLEMRWTKKNAGILIKDNDVKKISCNIMNRKKVNSFLRLVSSSYEQTIALPKEKDWSAIEIDLPDVSGNIFVIFESERVWRPLKDHRALGIAVANVYYKTNEGEKHIDIENDYKKFLVTKRRFQDHLIPLVSNRPAILSNVFDYLRGPNSPEMITWMSENIKNYDIIMAQMFPFNTIKYSMMAKKFNKPLVLLPLMHIDDEFYHWRHYYDFLREADTVFAISGYSKINLFDRIGANSIYVGAGIDKKIFLNDKVNGDRFKEKYGLAGKKIILTVSRKSKSKRYDLIIDATARIIKEYKDTHLVMIGPDEDNAPINREYVSYLGKVAENDLVDAYDACDIFCMMSESESFGMVFCEAWSRKKPVIGNIYCGPVSTLIDDGIDGFLCGNLDDIVKRIESLLNDHDLSASMGFRGFNKVIENYTWDKVADKVFKCYNDLAN